MRKKWAPRAATVLTVVVVPFLIVYFSLFSGIDFFFRDILYNHRRPVSDTIKIIAIDEKSIGELGPFGTWDRGVTADLLAVLEDKSESRPAVIVLDVLFIGETGKAGDDRLAQVVKENDNIVSAAHLVFEDKVTVSGDNISAGLDATMLELPFWLITSDDSVGFTNTLTQPDGTVRSSLIRYSYKGQGIDSLSFQTYKRFCKASGQDTVTPRVKDGTFIIDYAGNSGDFEVVSLVDVLHGRIDSAVFKDCAVFIGAYATGLQDNFYISTDRELPLYGVEIHANTFQNYLENRMVQPVGILPTAAATSLLVLAYLILTKNRRLSFCGILAAVVIGADIVVARILFSAGFIVSVCYLPAFMIVSFAYRFLRIYLEERLHRHRISCAFRKYVAPQVVEQIAKDKNFDVILGGELRTIAVLFVDIRGFTTMSECLPPQTVVSILNEYFKLVTNAIFNNGGMLDKFIGDAAMAVYNAPYDLPDYLYKAVSTAIDILSGAKRLEDELLEKFGRTIGFGIGVHYGDAVVGNIGCDFRMDYTAIGDTVNTAARLESNAKTGQIIIAESTYELIKDRISAEPIGDLKLKGKANPISVFNVTRKR